MMLTVWFGLGLSVIWKTLCVVLKKMNFVFKKIIFICVIVIFIFLPVNYLIASWGFNDRSDFWLATDWSKNVLESLEENSYLLLYNDQPALDSMVFSLYYMQTVENIRPDVRLINFAGIKSFGYNTDFVRVDGFDDKNETQKKEILAEYAFKLTEDSGNIPLYLLYPLGKLEEGELVTRSNGYVYRVYKNLDEAKKVDIKYVQGTLRNLEDEDLRYNMFYSDLVSDYYFAQSAYFLENGEDKKSGELLIDAIEYDVSPFSFNYQAFTQHREIWKGEK